MRHQRGIRMLSSPGGKNQWMGILISSDMNHSNMYAVGLALCTFANISSEEMSRDLSNEIEKLLGSSNSYIRKKVLPLLQSNAWWADSDGILIL